MAHIFISYSTKNREYAVKLADKLRTEGFVVWIDNRSLIVGEDWWRSIVLSLLWCYALVVILTPDSNRSKWVQREITLAEKYEKPIFPLLLEGDLNTPNWEIFVRTQVEDVRSGEMPSANFYSALTTASREHIRSYGPFYPFNKVDKAELAKDIAKPPPRNKIVFNKTRIVILAILAVSTVLFAVMNSSIGKASSITIRTQNPINFREGPSYTYPIAFPVNANEKYRVIGRYSTIDELWFQVDVSVVAWVDSKHVTLLLDGSPVDPSLLNNVLSTIPAGLPPERETYLPTLLPTGTLELTATMWTGTPNKTFTPSPTLTPTASDRAEQIAFYSNRDGNWGIYVMDADGNNVRRLIKDDLDARYPVWSPNGSKIAFYSNRDGNNEIYVMDADGNNVRRLTNNTADDKFSSWSPDGRQIAFESNRDKYWGIYVMDADGNNVRRLTSNAAYNAVPNWSPDGHKIVFTSYQNGNDEIYVMDADGNNLRRLTNNPADDGAATWSPDGQQIVFESTRDGNYEIYVMDADGNNLRRVTNNDAGDGYPVWSPDGRQIAFHSDRDGSHKIYVMDVDGINVYRLTNNNGTDFAPMWQPVMQGKDALQAVPTVAG